MNALRCLACLAISIACTPKPVAMTPTEPKAAEDVGCTTEDCRADADDLVEATNGFATRMCACQDVACAETTSNAMGQYMETMDRKYDGRPRPHLSEAQEQAMQATMERLAACMGEVHADAPAASKGETSECTSEGCRDVEEAILMMHAFADALCECTDRQCAERVTADMVRYGEALAREHEGQPEPPETDAQTQRLEAVMQRISACSTKAFDG